MTSLPLFMNAGVCKWKREGGENNQRDRRASLLRVLAHILTSPAPIPALLTQGQRLQSFLSFTLRLWLREVNKAHSEPFRPKTELDLQVGTLKLTEASRPVLGILLPVSKRNYDLKLFTPHQAPCPTSSLGGWECYTEQQPAACAEGTWGEPKNMQWSIQTSPKLAVWGDSKNKLWS